MSAPDRLVSHRRWLNRQVPAKKVQPPEPCPGCGKDRVWVRRAGERVPSTCRDCEQAMSAPAWSRFIPKVSQNRHILIYRERKRLNGYEINYARVRTEPARVWDLRQNQYAGELMFRVRWDFEL